MKIPKNIKCLIILAVLFALGILEFFGILWHTTLFTYGYSTKGLDVSHYQGSIDWYEIPPEYSFVFIKATEGDDFIDNRFANNWINANSVGLKTGAYHFFTSSCDGKSQAENFIKTVPYIEDSLPPVIDLEIALNKDKTVIREELNVLIKLLCEEYKQTPVIYVTYGTYKTYIMGYFEDSDIWIRDIFSHPKLPDGRDWLFWQYCNRGHVDGIKGYVDINVWK